MISLASEQLSTYNLINGNGPSTKIEGGSPVAIAVPGLPMAGSPVSERDPRRRSSPSTKPKPMRSRQLYAEITATLAGTIYFDMPSDTTIRQVGWSVVATGTSAADYLSAEVSLASSRQTNTTDAQGIIATFGAICTGGGSPANASLTGLNHICPCNLPVKRGDRIYLNGLENGGATWLTRVLVWFD